MDCAFVISWKVPFPGREKHALELAAEGMCSSPEWYFFPTGTGMWVVKGERRVLEDLIQGDEARRLLEKGTLLLQDWQWNLVETGNGAQRFMSEYARELELI